MRALRERWERRLAMRRQRGMEQPGLGLKEDLAYRVFPREMPVPVELATRSAYLTISRALLLARYGRDLQGEAGLMGRALCRGGGQDLVGDAALTNRAGRRGSRGGSTRRPRQ